MTYKIINTCNKNNQLDKRWFEVIVANFVVLNSKGNRGGYDVSIILNSIDELAKLQSLITYDITFRMGVIIINDQI